VKVSIGSSAQPRTMRIGSRLIVRWVDAECSMFHTDDGNKQFLQTPEAIVVADIDTTDRRAFALAEASSALRLGGDALSALDGDFAIAQWSLSTGRLIAARDHFGVRTLFYSLSDGVFLLSNRLAVLQGLLQPRVSNEFVADFLAFHGGSLDKTVWAGIHAVPPATAIRLEKGVLSFERFWNPQAIRPDANVTADDAAARFRELFRRSVRQRMDAPEKTWCHLSGGLDSSSVAATAASIVQEEGLKLGGAVTMTDSYIHAGEFPFAQEVIEKFNLASRVIRDDWPWRDDGAPPPLFDQPASNFPMYARDRVVAALMLNDGGKVLLTGGGADQLFIGSTPISADLAWRGEFTAAITELRNWSLCRGQSMWSDLISQVIVPLLSPRLSLYRETKRSPELSFICARFERQQRLRRRMASLNALSGHRGEYYQSKVIKSVLLSSSCVSGWHRLDGMATRHPFVDKDLVEFVLSLPVHLRARSFWYKPILRNSMKGVLPDRIRKRRSKGPPALRIPWAFGRERKAIERLMRQSILADCGCIEPKRLLDRVSHWSQGGQGRDLPYVYSALSLETWLQRSLVGAQQSPN